VAAGTEARTYILDKVVPVSRTTTTDLRTGESASSTTYALVPGTVQVQEHVGKKVEVTGTLVPGGDSKTETTTRVERDGDDSKKRERVETKNAMPEFRVTSIRDTGESCK
jgi:cytochrome c-type biogenesis protein CcmE